MIDKVNQIYMLLNQLNNLILELKNDIAKYNTEILELVKTAYPKVDVELFSRFLSKPYALIQRKEDEWYLVIPKFIEPDVDYGYLFQETESYRIYIVNRYIGWIYDLPEDLRRELNLPKYRTTAWIEDKYLVTTPELRDSIYQRYKKYLYRIVDANRIQVKRNRLPDLLAQLVKDGILPYKPTPVGKDDLIDRECKIKLRDYQFEAYQKFLKYGHLGIFYPPAMGKMYLSLYIMTKLKGKKLIVVPTNTLKEEWIRKIKSLTPLEEDEYQIITYQLANYPSFNQVLRQEWTLLILDEVHHIPSDTYHKIAWIKRKYTLGLSSSPYREDHREYLIFALSGFPHGLRWSIFREKGLIKPPKIDLFILKDYKGKIKKLIELVKSRDGKTIIFTDSIELGNKLSKTLNAPFIHGGTRKNRLRQIEESNLVILSRVGDEGIDITDIKNIYEVSFLYGSRRQQLQRVGRLLHSRYKGYYAILMTTEEYAKYRKRLYSILEKGFTINIKTE